VFARSRPFKPILKFVGKAEGEHLKISTNVLNKLECLVLTSLSSLSLMLVDKARNLPQSRGPAECS
jgi:hypothetical protein